MSAEGGGSIRGRTFGQALNELRRGRGLSVDEFAHQVGIPRTAVSLLEAGAQSPGPMTVDRLVQYFQLSGGEASAFRSLAGQPSVRESVTPDSDRMDRAVAPASATPQRIAFDSAIAAAAIAVLWASFDFAQGLPAVVLCGIGLLCLGCIALIGHTTGRVQRLAIVTFVCLIPVAVGILYWATATGPSSSSSRPTSDPDSSPISVAPSGPSTPRTTTDKPTSRDAALGDVITLYAGSLVIEVRTVGPTRATLLFSASGPQCRSVVGITEKVIVADADRQHWYEIRLAKIVYPKIVLTVTRGAGVVEDPNCT